MKIDWYTKSVLTVIALALAIQTLEKIVTPAQALNGRCTDLMPCAVVIKDSPIEVWMSRGVEVFGNVGTYDATVLPRNPKPARQRHEPTP